MRLITIAQISNQVMRGDARASKSDLDFPSQVRKELTGTEYPLPPVKATVALSVCRAPQMF